MDILKVCIISALLFFPGYAKAESVPIQETEHIYPVSFDVAWSKSIDILTHENFPIRSMDKENGIIQTDWNKKYMKHSWMSSGRYSLTVLILPVDNEHIKIIITPSYEISIPGNTYGTSVGKGSWQSNTSKDEFLTDKYFKIFDGISNKQPISE